MPNLGQLKELRKEFRKCNVIFQAEVCEYSNWMLQWKKPEVSKIDYEYHWLNEALNIFLKNSPYNRTNIANCLMNGYEGYIDGCLISKIKSFAYGDPNYLVNDDYKTWINSRGIPHIFTALTEEITQREAEMLQLWNDLKKKTSELTIANSKSTTLENQLKAVYPTYPIIKDEEKPENVKQKIKDLEDKATSLATDKATAQGELKPWTDAFGTKPATEIKGTIDNLSKRPDTTQENYNTLLGNQEKHTDKDLEKHKPEDLKPTDYDQIKTNLDTWNKTFPNLDFNQVKTEYDKPKEIHTAEQLEKHTAEQLKPVDLPNNWKTQLDKIPSLEARPDIPITKNDWENDYSKRPTQEQLNQATQKEKDKYKDYDDLKKELDDWHNNFLNKKPDEVLIERPILSQPDKDKITNFDAVNDKLNDWQNTFPNQTPSQIKNQVDQQGSQSTSNQQYLNKLLEAYKKEIKRETQAFYLNDLGLDESDDLQPLYGADYMTLLKNLNDSEPAKVINAFKIVALISATKKAQAISEKYKDSTNKAIRAKKLEYFKNVKKFWDLMAKIEVSNEQNALWLPEIANRDKYKQQINDIITAWQK